MRQGKINKKPSINKQDELKVVSQFFNKNNANWSKYSTVSKIKQK